MGLRGCFCPGQVDCEGFFGGGVSVLSAKKPGGDQGAAELDDHVEVGGLGLVAVPRCLGATVGGDVGAVAVVGVPQHHDALGDQSERDSAGHRAGGAVTCLAHAGDLLRVFERDLDRPPGGGAGHDLVGGGVQGGGEQRGGV